MWYLSCMAAYESGSLYAFLDCLDNHEDGVLSMPKWLFDTLTNPATFVTAAAAVALALTFLRRQRSSARG